MPEPQEHFRFGGATPACLALHTAHASAGVLIGVLSVPVQQERRDETLVVSLAPWK